MRASIFGLLAVEIFLLPATILGGEEVGGEENGVVEPEEAKPPLLRNWSLSGLAEFAYTWNINRPDGSGVAGDPDPKENNFRIFDTEHNNFDLHSVMLDVSKEATDDSWIGFRAVLLAGQDAKLIHATGLFDSGARAVGTGEDLDLVDAYITIKIPETILPLPTRIKIGKWETMHGAEVIPGPLNTQYSRSYLFGLAIPYTHTGILAETSILQRPEEQGEMLGVGLGIVNGWDNVVDDNDGKSYMGQVRFQPCDQFQTHTSIMVGPEQAGNESDWRGLVDINATINGWGPLRGLSISGNYDYGWEDNASTDTPAEYATWYGFAGYMKYRFQRCPFLKGKYIAFRGEWFNDAQGARTGLANGGSFVGLTTTIGYQPWENLLIRLEHRYDHSSEAVFEERGRRLEEDQHTFAVSVAVFY